MHYNLRLSGLKKKLKYNMSLFIQKFGGTSVGSIDRIIHVANIIQETIQAGHQVVVVVSAMSGETDRLIQLAEKINAAPQAREYDALLATGECVSAALVAMALQQRGLPAISLNGIQAQIETTAAHTRARITYVGEKISQLLLEKKIPIVTGFQGVNAKGDLTTLGRGGSDTTAVALAAFLSADECHIFTDVVGVFTADPRIVADAQLLSRITHIEMLALARLGSKVLHAQAAEFAKKHRIPVRILSSFEPGEGTCIHESTGLKNPRVSGIALDKRAIKITIMGITNEAVIAKQLLPALKLADFEIDMMIENHTGSDISVAFVIHVDALQSAQYFSQSIAKTILAREVIIDTDVAKLSLVGLGMKSHAGLAAKIFEALSAEEIIIQLITSTDATISVLVHKAHADRAVQLLHRAFSLMQPHGITLDARSVTD